MTTPQRKQRGDSTAVNSETYDCCDEMTTTFTPVIGSKRHEYGTYNRLGTLEAGGGHCLTACF